MAFLPRCSTTDEAIASLEDFKGLKLFTHFDLGSGIIPGDSGGFRGIPGDSGGFRGNRIFMHFDLVKMREKGN